MRKRVALFAIIGLALLAILGPIWLALYVAGREGRMAELERVAGYAQDVLRRSDGTSLQVLNAVSALVRHEDQPCGAQSLAEMRRIDVASSYIQAIGHVEGDRLDCSSLGMQIDLGPVDITSPTGVTLRTALTLPFAPNSRFLAVSQRNFAAIIHRDVPIDIALDQPDVSLATFFRYGNQIVTSRGTIQEEWVARLGDAPAVTFIDDGYVVAVAASPSFMIGAIAAVPVENLDQRIAGIAAIIVPVGILAGAALAFAVLYLARHQRAMPALIRSALRRNEFFLLYQPIVDLGTGTWIGAEALIRWRRSNGETMRPDQFIPIAEEHGLIQRLTERVVDLVAKDAEGLFALHPDFRISFNLAPADLQSEKTIALLDRLTEATGARKGNLIAEATERGFTDPRIAGPIIHALRNNGIAIAIDDFGTGYSSLAVLEALELDYLKIDKAFVDSLGTGAATSTVVHHIIDMARSLGLSMIAEGVETADQARQLRELGVEAAQGWHYSKALTMAQLRIGLTAKAPKP